MELSVLLSSKITHCTIFTLKKQQLILHQLVLREYKLSQITLHYIATNNIFGEYPFK